MGLYNADGKINLTSVTGSSFTGLYAADGSINIVINNGLSNAGAYHACGALNAVVVTSGSAYYADNGSINVMSNSFGGYSLIVPAGVISLATNYIGFSEALSSPNWTFGGGGTGNNTTVIPLPVNTLTVATQTQTPDSGTGTDPGHGFTCTGLVKDTVTGNLWYGNFGAYNALATGPSPQAQVVQMSPLALGTVVTALNLTPNSTIQGVAYDTVNDSLWWSGAASNLIYNINKLTGASIGTIAVTSFSDPNGIAYDSIRDGFWVTSSGSSNNMILIDRSGTVLRTYAWGAQGLIDHVSFDSTRGSSGYLWCTTGANGTQGVVYAFDIALDRPVCAFTTSNAYAIEGVYVDTNTMYIASDAYYHSVGTPHTVTPDILNVTQTYTVPAIPTQTYQKADAVYTNQGLGPFGRYPSRIIVNRGAGNTSADFMNISRASTVPAGTATCSVYMRSTDGVSSYNVGVRLTNATQQNQVVTGTWTRFTLPGVTALVNAQMQIITRGATGTPGTNDNFADILVTAAMVQTGSTATTYNPHLGA